MTQRYQTGYLRCAKRRNGPSVWELLYRYRTNDGSLKRRTVNLGTLEQYPTKELAEAAASGLMLEINRHVHRIHHKPILLGNLIDHYLHTRLLAPDTAYSEATKIVYRQFLDLWIRPSWGTTNIRDIRTVDVESWLSRLRLNNGNAMASGTKAKIRNLLSVIFNHAIRYEWLEQGKNPITFVRQPSTRQKMPTVLEPAEVCELLKQLESPFRLLVLLDVTTGLRRSELFALKWSDFDLPTLRININRSIFEGVVGKCKTRASQNPVPVDPYVARELLEWKTRTKFRKVTDWIFTSPTYGLHPFWPNRVLTRVIQPAAARAGITKRIGWHTFRHTYSTLLVANGENVKVVQELMRHASSRSTIEIYTQATIEDKRAAQQRLVQMLVPEAAESSASVSEETTRDLPARPKNLTGFDLMVKWETEEQENKYM
jgi:integrase